LPYTLSIANHGWQGAVRENHALAEGVNVADGRVVYKPVADAHGMAFTPLAQLVD
jgi:alanine dehydrogenase